MALVLKDRVKETTITTGTGTVTLAGAASGFQSFSVIGNGNETYYSIVDLSSGSFEVGIGTYTASGTTLSRTTVLSSSNGGSPVSFTAGSKDVFVTYPSSRAVFQNLAGTQTVQQAFDAISSNSINATTATLTNGTVSDAPVNNTDIVNKQYADAIATGINFHEAVELATAAALPANTYNNGTSGVGATLTATNNGILSVDSTGVVVANRILVKNEVAQANNGVYVVTQVGTAGTPYILTRASDFNTAGAGVNQINEGDFFLVKNGVINANAGFVQQSPPPITVGTTALVFQQFSAPITYTAGTGLNETPAFTFNIANTTVTAATYGSASSVPVFAVNAQGQLTSVTNTVISIAGAAVSGNIAGAAGSVVNALTLGNFLTGTSFNGSAAVTAAVDATSVNTASKVVARDASGNFAAGTITASLAGNASTVTTNANLTGAITSSGNATSLGSFTSASLAGALTDETGSGSNVFAISPTLVTPALGTPSSGVMTNVTGTASGLTAGAISGQANSATITATSVNTASQIVQRDASGNFAAGTITASLAGNASTASIASNVSGVVAVANGGTGASTSGTALTNLGAQATLVSGTNIKTVNSNSLLGAGNIVVAASPGGANTQVQFNSGGVFAGSGNMTFDGTSLTVAGNITANSDESLKTNWRDLPTNFVEKLAKVKHGTYERTDVELTQDGVSAQSLRSLLPNSVLTGEDGKLSVAYGNAALVAAIALAERVVQLEALVAKLVKDNS